MKDLQRIVKMKDWKRKILELESSLNSFILESTTERFVAIKMDSNKMVWLEALSRRVTELESRINSTNENLSFENKQVYILI